jgi:hypothetical protein
MLAMSDCLLVEGHRGVYLYIQAPERYESKRRYVFVVNVTLNEAQLETLDNDLIRIKQYTLKRLCQPLYS